jgi:hypothetical protein
MRRLLAVVTLILIFAATSQSKEWPLSAPKGTVVVAKVPTRFWQVDKYDAVSSNGQRIYYVQVKDLLDTPDWQTGGFPYCGEFTVTKVFEFRPLYKLRYTDIELRNSAIYLKLRFSPEIKDMNAEFQKLTARGDWHAFESSDEFRKTVFATQNSRIFIGPLAQLSDSLKMALMRTVCDGQNTFDVETFKSRSYFAVSLANDGTVYNSLRLDESARVRRTINEQLLHRIKLFRGVAQQTGIDGLKFTTNIAYRDFANETVARTDEMEVYIPLDLSMKFADADITSQQLLDGSIVLLNGNRIQVTLSGGS